MFLAFRRLLPFLLVALSPVRAARCQDENDLDPPACRLSDLPDQALAMSARGWDSTSRRTCSTGSSSRMGTMTPVATITATATKYVSAVLLCVSRKYMIQESVY